MHMQALAAAAHTVGARSSARVLRAALRVNAVFSFASGVLLAAVGVRLAQAWGAEPAWLPPVIGGLLIGFAVVVSWIAALPATALRRGARLIVAADGAWVAASLVVVLSAGLSRSGVWVVAAVAVAVAGLAAWQTRGLTSLRSGEPLADVEVIEASRVLAAPPQVVWPVVTDHELYGRLAPNLHQVQVISEAGQPLRRRCTNHSGDGWEETCTLWDDDHRYAVEVDTANYPYPLASLRGLWQVDPHPDGSLVTMRFVYQAKPTLRGGLFALVSRPLFPLILARIFKGGPGWSGIRQHRYGRRPGGVGDPPVRLYRMTPIKPLWGIVSARRSPTAIDMSGLRP